MSEIAIPEVLPFFDANSNIFSYIVKDASSNACAIIDAVLDFDYASGQVRYHSADHIIACVKQRQLEVVYLIETHAHADHLSYAPYIQSQLGKKIGISEKIHFRASLLIAFSLCASLASVSERRGAQEILVVFSSDPTQQ